MEPGFTNRGRFRKCSITHGSDSPQLAAFYKNAERSEVQANTPQLAAGKFIDIKKILTEEGLCPEEYFTLSYPTGCHADEPFPEISGLFCNAQWGGSEGIYLDIAINVFDSEEKNYKQISFITGKTLSESGDAFDRMQYIGGYIYRLLMGDGNVHARYILLQNSRQDKAALDEKLNNL